MQSRLTGGMPAKLSQGPRAGYDLSRMGAGAARGANRKKKLEAAPWSGTWPAPGSTLDLDFANNRGFVRGLGQGGVMDGITFTRASAGQYVDQNGLLVEAGNNVPRFDWAGTEVVANKNLLANTDSFASFDFGGVTRTFPASGETAPTGVSAALFTETASSGFHEASGSWSTPGVARRFTYSVYAKYNGAHLLLMFSTGTSSEWANFDLQNGQVGAASSDSNANIESIGGGWYRISVSLVLPASGTLWLQLQKSPKALRNTTYLGDGVSGVYVGGVQFEEGDTATDYQAVAQPTTNTPLRPTATCNGLLIEEARTNRLLWCRDATQTQWVKTDITAAKDQTGIDGVANAASSLLATADGGTCIQTNTLALGSRTGSVYLKRLTGTGTVQVSLDGTTWSTVDLSDTEWRRIVLSGTVTNPVVGVRLATSGDAVAMDYGQVEDGAFATSPILTTVASATRSSDEASIGSIESFWNYQCGTILFKGAARPINSTGTILNVGDLSYYRGLFLTAGTSGVVGAALSGNYVGGFPGPYAGGLANLTANRLYDLRLSASWTLNKISAALNGISSSEGNAVGFSLLGATGVSKYSLFFGSSMSNHGHTKTISRLVMTDKAVSRSAVINISSPVL